LIGANDNILLIFLKELILIIRKWSISNFQFITQNALGSFKIYIRAVCYYVCFVQNGQKVFAIRVDESESKVG